ncbi:unnamed protein product [Urochloa humidicola]
MATRAPGERPGDDGAVPPGLAAAAPCRPSSGSRTTQPAPLAVPPPAPQARSRLDARRGGGAPPRTAVRAKPGERRQNQLLLDFHLTAVPGEIAPAPPVSVWVTPDSSDLRYNTAFIQNMVNFLLTERPGRLEVKRVRSRVFRLSVSCRNVANALIVRSPLCLGSSKIWLHPSMATAALAASKLDDGQRTEHPRVTAHQPVGPEFNVALSNTTQRLARVSSAGVTAVVSDSIPEISSVSRCTATADFNSCATVVSPLEETCACRENTGRPPQSNPPATTTEVNAPQPPTASYLRALLTPATPQKTLTRPPRPITSTACCFRCLASRPPSECLPGSHPLPPLPRQLSPEQPVQDAHR